MDKGIITTDTPTVLSTTGEVFLRWSYIHIILVNCQQLNVHIFTKHSGLSLFGR